MTARNGWRQADIVSSAGELGERIRAAAGGARRVVALECGRGAASVIALLATLDAGCVPLLGSTADPADRRARLRAASGAAMVLSSLGDLEFTIEATPVPAADPGPDAVYMSATSGTTGEPKIMSIGRRVFESYVDDIRAAYALTPGDRVLQFAPPGFDVFLEEVVPTFRAGATLVIPPWGHAPAAAAFLDFLDENDVTMVNLPSSYWMGVADHARTSGRGMPASLRLAVVGSEPVSRPLVEWARQQAPHVKIINAYGTSELAPTCFVFDCDDLPSATDHPDSVPVGGPLPFMWHRIDPQPGSAYGRLHLGMTPHGTAEPEPAFDTGDLASLGADGFIYLHGRADLTRLKRGGVTVNAESLAVAARECADVLGAVAQLDRKSDALVLTVQSAAAPEAVAERVGAHLRAVLPSAWLPDRIQVTSGVGRVAGAKMSALSGGPVVPAQPGPEPALESTVREAWQRWMEGADISTSSDFFDSGGDSICAVRVCALLSDLLGERVPVQLIFANPRFSDFVDAVGTMLSARARTLELSS